MSMPTLRVLLLLSALLLPGLLLAHDARPLSVTMVEQAADLYRVVVRAPPTLPVEDAPTLHWPERCELLETAPLSLSLGSTSLVRCPGGIAGAELELRYPRFNPSLTTLVRLDTLDGAAITQVLPPDITRWTVAAEPDFLQIALQYTVLGFEHILEGLDHLLFVAGLLLLARHTRKIVLAITGFTLAHSLTLALATFELVRLPIDLVEALIALSVVFLAAEVARNDSSTFSQRFPILLSFVFGLLHGFGFASVLGEISLPTRAVVQGLAFFNIGVELGQLAFIAACLLLWAGFVRLRGRLALSASHWQDPVLLQTGAWFVGVPAAYWFIERVLPILTP
ncbi:MAG: HupE/UreJ family protein [Pseudohongiellaceae bacterium]